MCINICVDFVSDRRFDCSEFWSQDEQSFVQCQPRYEFNWAEKIGNVLLFPADWILDLYYSIDSNLARGAFLAAGVFTAVIPLIVITTLIAAAFKIPGEKSNPHCDLRDAALAKLKEIKELGFEHYGREIRSPVEVFFEPSIPSQRIAALFMALYENYRTLVNNDVTLLKPFQRVLDHLTVKVQTKEDFSKPEAQIRHILISHPSAMAQFEVILQLLHTRGDFNALFNDAAAEYNQIADQIALAVIKRVPEGAL